MRNTVKLLLELLGKKQRKNIAGLIIVMVISAVLETLGVSMIVPVVSLVMEPDVMESNEALAWVCRTFHIESVTELTILLFVVLIVLFVGKNLYQLWQYHVQAKFIYRNLYRTQRSLVNIFLHKPYAYYLGVNTADVVRLISMDSVGAYTALQYTMEMCAEIIVATMLAIAVFIMDAGMALTLGSILIILMLIVVKILRPKLKKYGDSHIKYDTAATKWLMQFVAGIKDIKIAESEDFFEQQYAYNDDIDKRMEQQRNVYRNVPRVMIESVCIAGVLIIFIVRLLSGNDIATMLPLLSAFAVAAVRLLPSANRISAYINEIAYNNPPLTRTVAHIREATQGGGIDSTTYDKTLGKDKPGKKQEKAQLTKIADKNALELKQKIELHDIYFKYEGSDHYILEKANMEIPIGKSIGVVGASGAGKTTAIDVMLGLLTPEKGEVLVDGVNIRDNYHAWLSHISYIPQTIYLLDDSIRANIIFGGISNQSDDTAVWKALKEAQLDEFIRSLPEGLDTQIGERGVRLSGGQRQRLGIARALYTNPDILVFDEATSALDNETEEALMEAINSLHGKKTMIIIAHRLQTIQNCDVVYRVGDGKVLKDEQK